MKSSLETERLLLRKIRLDDASAIYNNWASDPEVTKYLTWKTHENIETTKDILNIWLYENQKYLIPRFGIVLKETNELIGMIDVVNYPDSIPEIGYSLSRRYWNKGIMTEACRAFIQYLFELGYSEIIIEANEDNIGSLRVIEKCGFTYTHKQTKLCSEIKPVNITVKWYQLKNFKHH